MKIPVFLALGATVLLAPTSSHAAPGVPPGLANDAARRAQQTDVLYWYGLLPPQIFGAFGGADRLELLKGEGAIYDRNRGFIEVPVPGDTNQNDVEKLQVKLYQGEQGLMVGVSQIVWNQPRIKSALAFFALNNEGRLFDVTRQVFPYELNAAPADNKTDGKTASAPVNAYFARGATTIATGVPESETRGADYAWNKRTFVKREAPQNKANGEAETN